jgi:hypothetical protein
VRLGSNVITSAPSAAAAAAREDRLRKEAAAGAVKEPAWRKKSPADRKRALLQSPVKEPY